MSAPERVTKPFLEVLEVLLRALDDDLEVHGWLIMRETHRSGPTVYGVLDRLERAGWVEGHWEDQGQDSNRPRRRHYHLTPTGATAGRKLLAERRHKEHVQPHPKLVPAYGFLSGRAGGVR